MQLYSLQKGPAAKQLKSTGERMGIIDLGGALESFLDTAALACNLDLVISCDTAVGHLAGGLAVPVWLALPKPGEWRWLKDRSDSPWYPTMRLFRQPRLGDWAGLFEQMKEALAQRVSARTSTR